MWDERGQYTSRVKRLPKLPKPDLDRDTIALGTAEGVRFLDDHTAAVVLTTDVGDAKLGALRGALGHTDSKLFKDVHDDCAYLIISEWSDEQAFGEFIRSQAFREVTNWGKEQILSGRPQHKVYKH